VPQGIFAMQQGFSGVPHQKIAMQQAKNGVQQKHQT
jgi:hypothetical protein